jgi:hypothetical protein
MRKNVRSGFAFTAGVAALLLMGCRDLDPYAEGDAPVSQASAAQSALMGGEPAFGVARCPREVPTALVPPPNATLAASLTANGAQIYTCAIPASGGAPVWTLKAPHAVLLSGFDLAAIHFAGPTWQAVDGSAVVAARVASAPAPDATAIPWLLLRATSHTGAGRFDAVTFIQRLATKGGVAPASGCDADHVGSEVLASYGADYFFYVTAPQGAPVQQCASE